MIFLWPVKFLDHLIQRLQFPQNSVIVLTVFLSYRMHTALIRFPYLLSFDLLLDVYSPHDRALHACFVLGELEPSRSELPSVQFRIQFLFFLILLMVFSEFNLMSYAFLTQLPEPFMFFYFYKDLMLRDKLEVMVGGTPIFGLASECLICAQSPSAFVSLTFHYYN